jgi:hypothetical protein
MWINRGINNKNHPIRTLVLPSDLRSVGLSSWAMTVKVDCLQLLDCNNNLTSVAEMRKTNKVKCTLYFIILFSFLQEEINVRQRLWALIGQYVKGARGFLTETCHPIYGV